MVKFTKNGRTFTVEGPYCGFQVVIREENNLFDKGEVIYITSEGYRWEDTVYGKYTIGAEGFSTVVERVVAKYEQCYRDKEEIAHKKRWAEEWIKENCRH